MSLEFSAEEFGNEFAANFEYEPPPAHFQDSRSEVVGHLERLIE